jgi:hypothetical protein
MRESPDRTFKSTTLNNPIPLNRRFSTSMMTAEIIRTTTSIPASHHADAIWDGAISLTAAGRIFTQSETEGQGPLESKNDQTRRSRVINANILAPELVRR